ncbi:MAG: cyclohexanone monooxygenase [Frankiales bacterium]|nr:cyclohexanone monooxygenase [Frankiales bacterium]
MTATNTVAAADGVNAVKAENKTTRLDALVIGAGVGGLYMLHKLREQGFNVRAVEMGDGVGGTWYWNRYPGARVDVESLEYSFSFSKEIEQEWDWTEIMASQPELERYINFVADRLDLRRDIEFQTKVISMTFDEATDRWLVVTDSGAQFDAQFVIAATGCLSAPLTPQIEGLDSFTGPVLYTNRFPKEGFDFTGLRVGLIGTGSSGVQTIPVVAEQASELFVFQRSAAYTRPAGNRPLAPGELDEAKADYENIRYRQRQTFAGTLRFGAVSVEGVTPPDRRILQTPLEQRIAVVDELGWGAPQAWADVLVDLDANKAGTELYAELIRRNVKDAQTAEALVPHYPMGCKRQIIDTGYFETFNKDHVTLVDLRKTPIERITPNGLQTTDGHYEFDVLYCATGFDAMTGALNRIDIRGRDGKLLRDEWRDGPGSYLGLQVAGFPNLFTITGPGSPSVLANMIMAVEQHVDWIADCLTSLRDSGSRVIEAQAEAQQAWIEHAAALVEGELRASESCNSWYLGANIPGKVRIYMPYMGGLPAYRERCDSIAAAGYAGFAIA